MLSLRLTFGLFYLAVFLQASAYGLTFMLPDLFQTFGANEKTVGYMLSITALSTIITVYYSGHLSDLFGRIRTVGVGCLAIAIALASYGMASGVGGLLVIASLSLGFGWGITYALAPIVLTGIVGDKQRITSFALLSIAVMAGFGLSPVLASFLISSGFGIRPAFHLTALFCLISAMIFFVLRSSINAHTTATGPALQSSLSVANICQILASPARLPVVMVCIGASIFAGLNNFQTVFAGERGVHYADYFLIYTLTVVSFRLVLAKFKGGTNPYLTIALLQYIMFGSVVLFILSGGNVHLYWLFAFLFGIGYGVSYPALVAMAANDAENTLFAQTLQLFALTYFIGIFGFPLIAGWMIVEWGTFSLLILIAALAGLEPTMALCRAIFPKK